MSDPFDSRGPYPYSTARPYLPPRRSLRGNWVLMLGVWALVFLVVWLLFQPSRPRVLTNPDAPPRAITPRGDLAGDEQSTIELFQEASPSVVNITTMQVSRGHFSLDVLEIPQGTGSGFIYSSDGLVVTNAHVLANASRATVKLADGSEWDAALVGAELDKDLAVLKIDAPADRLKPLAMGSSSDLRVGQKVFAIGNPFGFDQTLTTGVVSALGREIRSVNDRPIHDVIQTDAAVNPGNSGGPLLDSAGRLIGVNTQIASPTGSYAGIGFAVPVDTVNRVVPQIIRHGRVIRPGFGVHLLPDHLARQNGLRSGVLIMRVFRDSAAARAGLCGTTIGRDGRADLGDIIVKVNDEPVADQDDLYDLLEKYEVGQEVRVTVLRDGREVEVPVTLQSI